MKKMMKVSAGVLLGALLCLAIFVTPAPANAATYNCSTGSFFCYDIVISGGLRYCNTGIWCNYPSVGKATCWYARC